MSKSLCLFKIATRIFLYLETDEKFVIMEIFVFPPAKVILTVQGRLDDFIFNEKKKNQNKTNGSKSEVSPEKEQKDQ